MDISDVFTAGGVPSITYNSRENLGLEKKLGRQLKVKGKLISITGPTKIGKTVLWKKVISEDQHIFIPGGYINQKDDIWNQILQSLNLTSKWSEEESIGEETKYADSYHGDVQTSILGLLKVKGGVKDTYTEGANKVTKTARSFEISPLKKSIEELMEKDIPLIIDDFHYIDKEIQTSIIRALKEPIAQGLKLIILSVPHRDHDTIKVENEMTGRVYQIRVAPWTSEELLSISQKGFQALNLICPDEIINIFIRESYKSPHLMQEFCYHLCLENNIEVKQDIPTQLHVPLDYEYFFREIVETSTSKVIYEKLVSGPPSRERKERYFKNGSEGDIYQAVMIALSELLDLTPITTDDIRRKLQDILEPRSVPQKNQISNVLSQMTKIAKDDIEGEPAIDYQDESIFIVDPFFSFYLKWCEK